MKIQTYDADSLTIDCDRPEFIVRTPPWEGMNYYELYRKIALPAEHTDGCFASHVSAASRSSAHRSTSARSSSCGKLDCPAYKIASFEVCDDPLLQAVARTGRPVIVSTGIANKNDIEETLRVLRSHGSRDVAFMHCVSEYPAGPPT